MPLSRHALIADRERIHAAMSPGSTYGQPCAETIQISTRQHALESGCFVLSTTA